MMSNKLEAPVFSFGSSIEKIMRFGENRPPSTCSLAKWPLFPCGWNCLFFPPEPGKFSPHLWFYGSLRDYLNCNQLK